MALTSHEVEDRVIEILSTQGFKLLFRAVTPEQLAEHVNEVETSERLVILTEEISLVDSFLSPHRSHIKTLQLNRELVKSNENLISAVNDAMRQPLVEKRQFGKTAARPSWIAVTGSSSSPGISTVALNIATEIATIRPCAVVDGDNRNHDLHIFLGTRKEGETVLNPSLSYLGIIDDRDREKLNITNAKTCVIDVGAMPRIDENMMTDRRIITRETLDRIFESKQLVYTTQPDHRAQLELESFLDFAGTELSDHHISFVINRVGGSQRQKSIIKSLRNRIGDKPTFLIPRDDALFDRAQGRFAATCEVGARSRVRKTLQEISVYLSNSI
jgi:Flp pilus assembly CpaE family ATPase